MSIDRPCSVIWEFGARIELEDPIGNDYPCARPKPQENHRYPSDTIQERPAAF